MNKSVATKVEDAKRLLAIASAIDKGPIRVAWNGIWVHVKRAIGLMECTVLIDDVLRNSTIQDGSLFMPELIDFALRAHIVEAYTDLVLPEQVEAKYDLLYLTDLFDVVSGVISKAQLDSIINAINTLSNRVLVGRNGRWLASEYKRSEGIH